MIFDKLFKKDKSEEYFLQIDTAETSTATETKEETNKAEPIKEESNQAETDKAETKEESKKAKASKSEATQAQASTDVSYEPPEWVKAIKNYSKSGSNSDGDSTTGNNFAGRYVTNDVAYSRRRPGGSLNKFKQMASQVGK